MLSTPKLFEILVIFIVLFFILGPNRLPSLGKALGDGIRNLRKGFDDDSENNREVIALSEQDAQKNKLDA